MKLIIYANENGGVAICSPAPEYLNKLINSGQTESEALDFIAVKDVPVELTESWDLNGTVLPIGERVPKLEADLAGKKYNQLGYEIVKHSSLPWDEPFDAWEWV